MIHRAVNNLWDDLTPDRERILGLSELAKQTDQHGNEDRPDLVQGLRGASEIFSAICSPAAEEGAVEPFNHIWGRSPHTEERANDAR